MSEWIPYQQLDFADEKYIWYNIDTRDFHGVQVQEEHSANLEIGFIIIILSKTAQYIG